MTTPHPKPRNNEMNKLNHINPIDRILSSIKEVKKHGDKNMGLCPAHNDTRPSLSIAEGHDGRVLLYCHAGCKFDEILRTLDLKPSDLYRRTTNSDIAIVYKYLDQKNKLIFEIVRTESKEFYVRRRLGEKYINNVKNIELVPYNLINLLKAIKINKSIILVEGEKDSENVIDYLGLTATTFAFGLKWQDCYAQYFVGAKVVIIPDNDRPGRQKAELVAANLYPHAKGIKLLNLAGLPEKGDISDWIDAGGTKNDLINLIMKTPKWQPSPEVELSEIDQIIRNRVLELNQRYATVLSKSNFMIVEVNRFDPSLCRHTIELMMPYALKQHYAHDKIIIGYKGEKPIYKDIISVWLEHPERLKFEGIVFDPGKDHGDKLLNLYRGFAVKAKPQGSIEMYLNHVYEVIANGDTKVYDHLIALMADAVQLRPRPGVAVAILGSQGVGKGVFINNFGALFGRHFVHLTQSSHLTGRFNSHLTEGMLVFVDESFWAGDKSAEGVLKGLITEDTLMIEGKGKDAYVVKNHNRLFMATNNNWMVPAGMEERRFFVMRASDKYRQNHDYFSKIQEEMVNGGREKLLHYLQQYDLIGVKLADYPRTDELANQKLLSMDTVQRFWYSVLQSGKLFKRSRFDENKILPRSWKDSIIEKNILFAAFNEFQRQEPSKWKQTAISFGIALNKLVPNIRDKKLSGVTCYALPTLQECRDEFDARTKQDWKWPVCSES